MKTETAQPVAEQESLAQRAGYRLRQARGAWATFGQNRLALMGLVLILLFGLMALAHPILLSTVWPPRVYDPETGYDAPSKAFTVVPTGAVADLDSQIGLEEAKFRFTPYVKVGEVVDVVQQPAPMSFRHPLGTDFLGRDVSSMIMASAGRTFILGIAAGFVTALLGTVLGALSAYFRRVVDAVLGQVANTLLLLPAPIFMVVLGARFDLPAWAFGLMFGVVAGAGPAAIVLRSRALAVMGMPFVDAARVAGAKGRHIIRRHLIPNLVPLAAAHMLVAVTGAVVADGFLAWTAHSQARLNWGTMIFDAIYYDQYKLTSAVAWNAMIVPAVAISLFCAALFLVALGLRDVADSSLQRRA